MDWQQIVALVIVAAAFWWLLRTQVFKRGQGAGCGGCGGCGDTREVVAPKLISLDELTVLSPAAPPVDGEPSRPRHAAAPPGH